MVEACGKLAYVVAIGDGVATTCVTTNDSVTHGSYIIAVFDRYIVTADGRGNACSIFNRSLIPAANNCCAFVVSPTCTANNAAGIVSGNIALVTTITNGTGCHSTHDTTGEITVPARERNKVLHSCLIHAVGHGALYHDAYNTAEGVCGIT